MSTATTQEPQTDDFIGISIPVFQRMKGILQFDVYIKRAATVYTKIFPKGETIDHSRLASYNTNKGVTAFFVHKGDYRQYLYYVEQVANNLLSHPERVTADDLVPIVKEMTDLTMLEMLSNVAIDQKAVSHATQTIQGCIEVFAKDPKSLVKIFSLMSRHPYMLKHSIATSVFTIMLCKSANLSSDKTLMTVGLGALLHDIGMSQLPFDAEEKTELTAQEWKDVKEHPQIGKRMLDGVKISPEVRSIVLQHHEQPNGRGYPNGLHDKDIYFLAKIVAICDSFSALVSPRPYREEQCSPLKGISIMQEDRGKFDPKLLELFSRLFIGVKRQ